MKKLIFLLLIVIVGCKPTTFLPDYVTYYGNDFSKYSEKGFLMTPYSYYGDYIPIADLTVVFEPEMTLVKRSDTTILRSGYEVVKVSFNWEKTTDKNVLDILYEACIKMGADALVDFTFKRKRCSLNDIGARESLHMRREIQEVSGFAIKRL